VTGILRSACGREHLADGACAEQGGPVTPPRKSHSEIPRSFVQGLFPSGFECPDALDAAFLCDRVTVILPVIVPEGLKPDLGLMWLVDPRGLMEGFRHRRRVLEGSWETRATVEVTDGKFDIEVARAAHESGRSLVWLRIDGNPVKWRQGFNVFGSSDVIGLASEFCSELVGLIGLDGIGCDIRFDRAYFTRVDATMNFDLGTFAEASSLVRQLSRLASVAHRKSSSFDSSILFPARHCSLSIYHKGPELKAHPGFREVEGLQEVCDRIVRFEVVARSEKLAELGLRSVSSWQNGTCVQNLFNVWWNFVSRLRFPVMVDIDLSSLTGPQKRIYSAWRSGMDVLSVASRATAYRHRNAIIKAGGPDILLPRPTGDVVEFRRVLRPVLAPVPASILDLVYRPRAA
jgi:hypothetical protein